MDKKEFLTKMFNCAVEANHIFPFMAACEAALESGWGESQLFRECNNPFGQKQGPYTVQYPTVELPTTEYTADGVINTTAKWVNFPDIKSAFVERMNLLRRLQVRYPDYQKALLSLNATDFILNVSKTWATDPMRGTKVMNIFMKYGSDMGIDPTSAKLKLVPFKVVDVVPKPVPAIVTEKPWFARIFDFFGVK
jgi:flagellum-specific peptidoglycan hydrolase FlgJ